MQELQTCHPDLEMLTAFGLGRVSEADSRKFDLHLADCDECRKKLEDVPADSLVRLLQNSASEAHVEWDLSDPSVDIDSSSSSKESVPPLYKRLSQIIAGKKEGQATQARDPKQAPAGIGPIKADFTVPTELDGHARYLVLEPLGAGGMGTVYKAQHRLMERIVALKIVNPHLVKKPGAMERFTREVKLAAQLVHPNIVTAYDAEKVGNMHLLVMEFVEGQTLAQVLNEQRELPVAKACEYLRQTAIGLQHALERGMVHRDIKPQNLMLTSKGEIKILDFGLARFVSEQGPASGSPEHGVLARLVSAQGHAGRSTGHGALMGSPDYMAPEQARDAHAADIRADIYGMGCSLYHLLAAQVPFPASTLLAKLEAHRDQQPIPLNHLRVDAPIELAKVVEKMMAKDPAQRYQSPAEVAEALRPFTHIQPEPPVRTPVTTRRSPAFYRKPIFALAIAVAFLLAGIGAWVAQIVFRVETPKGTLIVTTDDPDVEIRVKSGGKDVILFFPKDKKEVPLKVGDYTIELVGGKDGLKLSANKFSIESAGQKVTVEFVPARGTLVVNTDDPNVEVLVKSSGKDIIRFFPKTKKEVPLAVGTYTIELVKGQDGSKLSTNKFVLKSGEQQTVTVEPILPSVEELLKTRDVLTVAQDGSSGYKTIQEALDAVQAKQVILVKDKGPYREFISKALPADVALVSLVGTRIEIPKYTTWGDPTDKGKRWYYGAWLNVQANFRLSGFEWVGTAPRPDDLRGGFLLALGPTGNMLVERCSFQGPDYLTALTCLTHSDSDKSARILIQDNVSNQVLELHNVPGSLIVQRNWLSSSGTGMIFNQRAGTVLIRNNIVKAAWPITFNGVPVDKANPAPGMDLSIHNNVLEAADCPIGFTNPYNPICVLPKSARIANNILRSQTMAGVLITPEQMAVVKDRWVIGPNAYQAEPKKAPKSEFESWPIGPRDPILAKHFLSVDPHDAGYLRIAADGDLAKKGAGGDLPTYFGAFPPGPAPKEGDWFTRMVAKGKEPIAKAPEQKPWGIAAPPPSLRDWLATKKKDQILTVAQDGKAMFNTLQKAIEALKPGQVVKVLDKGPYRELLMIRGVDDTALVSEVGTRIEIPKWHLWGPDPWIKGKNIYQGLVFHSSRGLRLSGFEVICPEVPADTSFAVAVDLGVGGELVLENCRIVQTPSYDRDPTPKEDKNEGYYALGMGMDDPGPASRCVVRDNHLEGTVDFARGNATDVLMERNRVIASRQNVGVRVLPPRGGETVIRHNVIHSTNGIYLAPQDPSSVAKARYLIANNTLDVYNGGSWAWSAKGDEKLVIPRNVRIHNNIVQSRSKNGFEVLVHDYPKVKAIWQVGYNGYRDEPPEQLDRPNNQVLWPLGKTDIVRDSPFLADDRVELTKYLRIAADGPLATGGAGGDLPKYMGAFPPGPAPKDGDWFTRLLGEAKR